MLLAFFRTAMLSVSRQAAFRRSVVVHVLLVAVAVWLVYAQGNFGVVMLGQILLVTGIAEGAVLIGWRLTQMPKSQALEFLLVSPVQPRRVFWAEALVGLGRLALVTLAGVPVLALLAGPGWLAPIDFFVLTIVPFTWGAITGLSLTVWAYEAKKIRFWGEAFAMAGIGFYLIIGVLAVDRLSLWFGWLPAGFGKFLEQMFRDFHTYNPFGVMQYWMQAGPEIGFERTLGLEVCALLTVGLLLVRAASRLKGHFHERHYRPIFDERGGNRGQVGEKPLSWWAVKRVTEYSGRVNLWLAGGFCLLYAAYTMAGSAWPAWMGRRVFEIVDLMGGGLPITQGAGVPIVATGLVVLAAVPAAFQYGLWDSNAQDRCRRLELLLLTDLEPRDYWDAAASAAWRRGRGYFFVAVVLWGAAWYAGRIDGWQMMAALVSSLTLGAFYFALGFRAFASGMQANGLGSLLTLGLPMVTVGLNQAGWTDFAVLLPPGNVYAAAARPPTATWALGLLLAGSLTLILSRYALLHCDRDLRRWYEQHHGRKVLD